MGQVINTREYVPPLDLQQVWEPESSWRPIRSPHSRYVLHVGTNHQAPTASRNNLAFRNTPSLSTLAGELSSWRVPALGRVPCPWPPPSLFPLIGPTTWPCKASRPPPHSGSASRSQSTHPRTPALTFLGTSRFPPTGPGILQEANNQTVNQPSSIPVRPVRFPSFSDDSLNARGTRIISPGEPGGQGPSHSLYLHLFHSVRVHARF